MGKLVIGENDLLTWCKANGERGQQLIDEWTGLDELNNPIEMNGVSRGNSKKVRWRCKEKHEWVTTINNRTSRYRNCPYCSGQKVSDTNSLLTWCNNNGEKGQQLKDEWLGLDEDNDEVKMDEVSRASQKKVKWRCKEKHEWVDTIAHRTNVNRNCPYCSGHKVSDRNSIFKWCNNNGVRGQQLKDEWLGLDENNNHLEMNKVSYGSNKKVKWRCKEKHEWLATICSRTNGTNCPYCSGNKVSDLNSLSTWCIQNGEWGKQLISEWTGLDEDNNEVKMDEVSRATTKKIKWRCKEGHKWIATIHDRTSGRNCPECNTGSTSYPEQFIYWSFKQIYKDTINRHKLFKDQIQNGLEYDIYIPTLNTAIEYSPTYWHYHKIERDILKRDMCKQNNIHFIEIVEDSYDMEEHMILDDYICFKMNYRKQDVQLQWLVKELFKILNIREEIDFKEVSRQANFYSKNRNIEKEKTLAFLHPSLVKEWNPSNTIKPDEVSEFSGKVIMWQCTNCGYGKEGDWKVTIHNRASGKSGCPSCGYNWWKEEQGLPQNIQSKKLIPRSQANQQSKTSNKHKIMSLNQFI